MFTEINMLTVADVRRARERIAPYIHRTPVFTSATLDELAGRKLFLKAECFQKTGSFKVRGALNAVTHSSGNHGQAVAYAAKICGLPCCVVSPSITSAVKIEAMKNYGAEVVLCQPSPSARDSTCAKIAQETGNKVIHPYDNYNVIAGQGTAALELLEEVPDLDAILVPISGGGLTSGTAIAAKGINPKCKVFPVEPYGKELQPCLEAGQRLWPNPPRFVDTIGDGLGTQQLGQLTFPIVCAFCEKTVFSTKDDDMVAAMRLLWERVKIVAEVSSAAALAAALSDQMKCMDPNLRKIGVILSGGNVDLDKLPWRSNETSTSTGDRGRP